jgi:hypothetical protein
MQKGQNTIDPERVAGAGLKVKQAFQSIADVVR